MKQTSFASAECASKKRQTRRERFLEEMNAVVPWSRLEALIEPHYPRSGKVGRPPIGAPRMLRMYFLQQWYTLADEALETRCTGEVTKSIRRTMACESHDVHQCGTAPQFEESAGNPHGCSLFAVSTGWQLPLLG